MASPTVSTPIGTAGPGSVERLIAGEHAEIRTHLGHFRELAMAFPALDETTARQRAGAVLDFLTNGLLPHAAAEEAVLYPAIDGLVGLGAARTMTLDHEEIGGLVSELSTAVNGNLGSAERAEAQRLLFVLEEFVTTHLWKEETAYVPLLARLDPAAYTTLHAGIGAHVGDHGHAH